MIFRDRIGIFKDRIMPLIRDYTHSDKIEALTPQAEVLFIRLLLKADVAGNFYANPELIKNICFPLKTNVRTADIVRWLKELSTPAAVNTTDPGKHTSAKNTALLRMYTGNDSKPYLHIFGYGQKLKYGKPKHPPPEVEVEEEGEDEVEKNARGASHKKPLLDIEQRKVDFINKVSVFRAEFSDEFLKTFCDYWTEHNETPNALMRFEKQDIFQISKRLATFKRNEKKYGKQQTSGASPQQVADYIWK